MKKLLIANRGEIAVRIIRTARRMGIRTVVACSEADVDSLAAAEADEYVVIGPPASKNSYLNIDAVVRGAQQAKVDAVHPGYGFLSENADFARACAESGLTWVGPSADVIALMGDKVAARRAAEVAGVPILEGSNGPLDPNEDALALARRIGFPIVIKAAAGGGGRGIRVVNEESDFLSMLDVTRAEAGSIFGDETVYLERFVNRARHLEVQILGDGENVVHLGDRDCTMQRRSQKLVEEAPAPGLPERVRTIITETAVQLAKECSYTGAGTVEFIYDIEREEAFFIEMNTRLQVEHPITEEITGIDIVEHQLRIADGETETLSQDDIRFAGHAFECRINAEDPSNGFFPSPGMLQDLRWPEGDGIRVDAGVQKGSRVVPYYDSMIAKIIVRGADRHDALARLRKALSDLEIRGVTTTVALHKLLAATQEFTAGTHDTKFIEDSGILRHLENAGR